MKKFMFELQAYKKIYVEAEDAEEARMKIIEDEQYQEIEVDYVSDGEEVEEKKCKCNPPKGWPLSNHSMNCPERQRAEESL